MNDAVRNALVNFLTKALRAMAPTAIAAPAPVVATLTAAHLRALPRFLTLIPISDLVALATGTGTIDDAFSVAEAGASIVARAFPPGAITAEEVRLGLEALQIMLDAAGIGPSAFRFAPGYRPVVGGFAGARGHV